MRTAVRSAAIAVVTAAALVSAVAVASAAPAQGAGAAKVTTRIVFGRRGAAGYRPEHTASG